MRDLIAGEWLKLRTTRLLHGTVPVAVALSVLAVAGSVLATARTPTPLASPKGLDRVLPITGTGALVVLLVGVLISAGEFRHGTAVDTFLTSPVRQRVVAAKLVVGALVGAAAGVLTVAACLGTATALFAVKDASFPWGEAVVWETVAGTILYTTLFAVLGVALGTLVRNQVLAVAGTLAWIGVVEHILVNLAPTVGRWLPAGAGQAIVRTPLDGLLSPPMGALIVAGYAAIAAVAGVRFAMTRDA